MQLRHEGCRLPPSHADVEVISSSQVFMTWGWGVVRRTCAPARRHILHFALDRMGTMTFKVFGADGRRLSCGAGYGLAGDHSPCRQGSEALTIGCASDSSGSSYATPETASSSDESYKPPSRRPYRRREAVSSRRRRC